MSNWVKRLSVWLVVVSVALAAAACAPRSPRPEGMVEPPQKATALPASAPAEGPRSDGGFGGDSENLGSVVTADTPEAAARAFYVWYLEQSHPDRGASPLAEGTYTHHPLLADALVARVEETVASFEGGGYDPFLCAQDLPTAVSVSQARIYENQAWLTVYTTLPGHSLDLALARSDNAWRISEINCRLVDASSRTPEQVAGDFFDWYIHYPGNAIADQQYLGFGLFLTQRLIDEIEETVAGFEGGGFDPVLYAQDVPMGVSVGQAKVTGQEATLNVYTTFPGHVLDVTLQKDGALWRIDRIACSAVDAASRTPEQVVTDFCAWYAHYPGSALADRAYMGFGLFLTQDLIDQIDETVQGFSQGGYDPILLAQDKPQTFTVVDSAVDGANATVTLETSFEGHVLVVQLVKDGSLWRIAEIELAE